MIKPLKIFLFISLSSLLLAACGSTSTNGTSPTNKENPPAAQGQASDQSKNTMTDKDSSTSTGANSTGTDKKDVKTGSPLDQASPAKNGTGTLSKTTDLPKEKQIQLDDKGKQHAKGTIYESTHIPLYIYAIPGYQVSEGQSGKDLVVASKNGSIKMTVAPLENGVTLEEAKKTAMQDMQKISQNVKEITTLKNDKFYQKATVLYASNAKEIESVYLLPIDGYPLKVTIDRPEKTDAALPYLQAMMKSIGVKN